ncbi:MAG: nucleoid-associated protein [Bacteroidales bacterium]
MPRESVLSIADKEAIKIEKLIFHIIIKDQLTPTFLDELNISDEQQKFFRDLLAYFAQGRQYIFADENSKIKRLSKEMVDDPDTNFIKTSKEIAEYFQYIHTNNTSDGVFVISIASINNRKLIFLIKIDHKKIYKYKLNGLTAFLEEVTNTFTEDKTAIQKVALIDIDSNVIWDVLVYDRSKPTGITAFFAKFLTVIARETESDLTKKMQSEARLWATTNKLIIDPNQEPSIYKNRATDFLLNNEVFNTEDYINHVIIDEDNERRELLKTSLRTHLVDKGLSGQTFKIKKEAITKKETKNIRQTAEGVRFEWSGNPSDNNINIPINPNANGEYIITITTNIITEIQ